ncbi:histidine kinase dimerization/phosphoacceptor domain -containing protein [Salinarimonas sp.]|uniref:sensor histidine kinase n=1 Tax=Salinarimonas sp. TaxID=2766526 RepID=UPI0032D955CA
MSLAARLAVLILAAVLPLVVALLAGQKDLYREMEADVRAEALQQARFLAGDLSQLVDGIRQVQAVLAGTPQIRGGDAEGCSETLQRIVDGQALMNNVLVADAKGDIWCDGVHRPEDVRIFNVADRRYFRRARAERAFSVDGYAIGRSTDAPVVHFATPVETATGGFAGVVITAVDLRALAARLQRPIWTDGQAILVADRDGVVLVRHPDNQAYLGRRMTPELLALLDDPGAGGVEIAATVDGVPRVIGYVPPAANPGGFYVGVGVSRTEAYAILDRANLQGVLLTLGAGAAAALAAWLVASRTVRRPVGQLLAATERWRGGDLSARADLSGAGEIAELGHAFDALANDLEGTLDRKEMLLRELAHRTMNNLQVLGSLLTLQKRSVGDDAARRELDEAAGRVKAMAAAYRNLHRSDHAGAAVDFAQLLDELCASMQDGLMREGARIEVRSMPLVLTADRAMPLALAANELLTNAVKYGGARDVVVELAPEEAGWRLAVGNQGPPLPEGFDPSRSSGFGLRMVATMAEQAGGRLACDSRDGWTRFTVLFVPAVPGKRADVAEAGGETA